MSRRPQTEPVKQLPAGTHPVVIKRSHIGERDAGPFWFILWSYDGDDPTLEGHTSASLLPLTVPAVAFPINKIAHGIGIAEPSTDMEQLLLAEPERAKAAIGWRGTVDVYESSVSSKLLTSPSGSGR